MRGPRGGVGLTGGHNHMALVGRGALRQRLAGLAATALQGLGWEERKHRPVVSPGWGLGQSLGWAAWGPGPGATLSASSSSPLPLEVLLSPGTGRGAQDLVAGTDVLRWPRVCECPSGSRSAGIGGGWRCAGSPGTEAIWALLLTAPVPLWAAVPLPTRWGSRLRTAACTQKVLLFPNRKERPCPSVPGACWCTPPQADRWRVCSKRSGPGSPLDAEQAALGPTTGRPSKGGRPRYSV